MSHNINMLKGDFCKTSFTIYVPTIILNIIIFFSSKTYTHYSNITKEDPFLIQSYNNNKNNQNYKHSYNPWELNR